MTSIYNQRLNEKTLARRRHVRAVIQSRLGKELTAKDREQISDAYLESYEGDTFCKVRNKNTKTRITTSIIHISAEVMDHVLNPGKKPDKKLHQVEKTSTKPTINPYTQKPLAQGHGVATAK